MPQKSKCKPRMWVFIKNPWMKVKLLTLLSFIWMLSAALIRPAPQVGAWAKDVCFMRWCLSCTLFHIIKWSEIKPTSSFPFQQPLGIDWWGVSDKDFTRGKICSVQPVSGSHSPKWPIMSVCVRVCVCVCVCEWVSESGREGFRSS